MDLNIKGYQLPKVKDYKRYLLISKMSMHSTWVSSAFIYFLMCKEDCTLIPISKHVRLEYFKKNKKVKE